METIKTTRIVTRTHDLTCGLWDDGESKFIELGVDSDIDALAKKFGCDPILLRAITIFIDEIKITVGRDLVEIWERLDKLEEYVKSNHT